MDELKYLIKNFPHYIEKMKECSYHYDEDNLNYHHLEGDVWSHTMMSYSNAINENSSKIIKWAILLHDIGRIITRKDNSEKKSVSFGDFEGVSIFLSLDILKYTDLTENEKIRILKIIAFQYTIIDYIKYDDPNLEELIKVFEYEEEILFDLAKYVKSDLLGRIVDSTKKSLYKTTIINKRIDEVYKIKQKSKNKTTRKNSLYILVGVPCSGKSTWVKENNENAFIISRDYCIENVGKKYGKLTHDEAYDLISKDKKIDDEVSSLEEERENYSLTLLDKNIIIDNPNLKEKFRKKWIDKFKNTHNIKVIIFLTSFEELIRRDNKRKFLSNKSIGKKAIINKLKSFNYPLKSEGIDDIQYLINL